MYSTVCLCGVSMSTKLYIVIVSMDGEVQIGYVLFYSSVFLNPIY